MESSNQSNPPPKKKSALLIEGYPVKGLSIGGQETCVIFPSLKMAFGIGRCPQRAISQDFLFISHGHMDHIGGLPMYVATRGLFKLKPPTVIVPVDIKEHVERLLEVHRAMDQSELKCNLVGLNIGEELQLRKDLKVKAFKTYHVIPSQGYIIYSTKQKLKQEYIGLSGNEIKKLKLSGTEITYTVTSPEIAFTGDTMSDFILDPNNTDVLRAKVLVVESTFVNDAMTVEHARDYGHTHLFEIVSHRDKFHNKAILLIHFSACYEREEIQAAVSALPPDLARRVFCLTEGFNFYTLDNVFTMETNNQSNSPPKKKNPLKIEEYLVEGLSIGGQETCVIFPSLKMAFDIGRCPQRAVSQDFLFISHGHMDHIGGLPMYVAMRGLFKLKPPTVIVPLDVKENVEKLLEVHRQMDRSELKCNLIVLNVGEELQLREDLKVKAFKTYHVIPSQGYIIYSTEQKLKQEYIGLSGNEITYTPEIAFTGDTMSDFILDPNNTDVLRAKILILESTFVNDAMTVEHARDYGHTHLFEIVNHRDKLHNKAILLIHFSARYEHDEIQAAVSALPPGLAGRVFALTEGY